MKLDPQKLMPNARQVLSSKQWAMSFDEQCEVHFTIGSNDRIGEELVESTLKKFGDKATHYFLLFDAAYQLYIVFKDEAEGDVLDFYHERANISD